MCVLWCACVDTDEVFGYWEPLHYLLYDQGMQTWEYSPAYAIRSYTFLTPFWVMSTLMDDIARVTDGRAMFYILRVALGVFSVYCQYLFYSAVQWKIDANVGLLLKYLMYCSAGVLFYSTSFLPSAICCNFFLLSAASYIRRRDLHSIFYGCIAVCCTGWPFVGVLFWPLGVHMLYRQATWGQHQGQPGPSAVGAVRNMAELVGQALVLLVLVVAVTVCIDSHMYQKPTFPALNILLYNAVGATSGGDELYGVEPAAYYVKNLLLTMGPAAPLAALSPLGLPLHFLFVAPMDIRMATAATTAPAAAGPSVWRSDGFLCLVALWLSGASWLGLLFSRPHKEDRFLYPAYPVVLLAAAVTANAMVHVLFHLFWRLPRPAELGQAVRAAAQAERKQERLHIATAQLEAYTAQHSRRLGWMWVLLGALVAVSGAAGYSRVYSNYRNYGGVMGTWEALHGELTAAMQPQGRETSSAMENGVNVTTVCSRASMSRRDYELQQKRQRQRLSASRQAAAAATSDSVESDLTERVLTVCMGGDWYSFPSHFFLPRPAVTVVSTATARSSPGRPATATEPARMGTSSSSLSSATLASRVELQYVHDTFHGLLPAHFAPHSDDVALQQCSAGSAGGATAFAPGGLVANATEIVLGALRATRWGRSGTFAPPSAPFNDRNREEPARYVPLARCDYVVTTVHTLLADAVARLAVTPAAARGEQWQAQYRALLEELSPLEGFLLSDRHGLGPPGVEPGQARQFEDVLARDIVDPEHSPSLTRAYYIPRLTEARTTFNRYSVFRRVHADPKSVEANA